MIQAADLAQFESLKNDEEKYKPLHSHVEFYNKRAARTATEFAEEFPLFQPNLEEVHNLVEEAKPFVAGFKRELDEVDQTPIVHCLIIINKLTVLTFFVISMTLMTWKNVFSKLSEESEMF